MAVVVVTVTVDVAVAVFAAVVLSLARPVSGEEPSRKSPYLPPAAPKKLEVARLSKWATGTTCASPSQSLMPSGRECLLGTTKCGAWSGILMLIFMTS